MKSTEILVYNVTGSYSQEIAQLDNGITIVRVAWPRPPLSSYVCTFHKGSHVHIYT